MHFVIISIYYLPLVGFLFRMVAPNSKRSIIIILYQAGNQTKDIVKLMKISRTMVQKTVKRFKEIGSAADRPGRGRKRSARTEQNKTSFVRWFDEIPEDPYEKWAKNWKSTKNRSESSSGRTWDSTPTESKKSPRTHRQNYIKQTWKIPTVSQKAFFGTLQNDHFFGWENIHNWTFHESSKWSHPVPKHLFCQFQWQTDRKTCSSSVNHCLGGYRLSWKVLPRVRPPERQDQHRNLSNLI